ncbi:MULTISPECIES: toll/interleukin-1 receptor domain-containing protein [unclassified Streptomyces]|uniref:toll/interleukin-1 receptor domain-containing protein n=1 Tax=unclassified Streptomyces TaxID=2593676 RepID=UPI00363C36D1
MADVFINYRTGDGEETAVAIERELTRRFGKGRIFRSGTSIRPGALWDDALLTGVRTSSVLVALIGARWADSPRLLDRDDWVRREILEAFRCAIPVVPVLVGRETKRLRPAALPSALRKLARCQSVRYDSQTAETDLPHLGDVLRERVPALADAEARLRAQQQPQPDATQYSMGAVSGGTAVQARDITGDIGGTVIREAHGTLHTGSGDQHHHAPHLSGDNSSYVAGNQSGGGNRQSFDAPRRRRDDAR